MTCDISSTGVSFQCRHPLPADAYLEMVIDWPSKKGRVHRTYLRAGGNVVRSHDGMVAVRMTSWQMVINKTTSPTVMATSRSRQ